MDNLLQDKDSQIRLTIRQYILPLIHAIYEDDPADVILFCYGYFQNLLREKAFKEYDNTAADRVRASSYQQDKETVSKEKKSQPTDVSCSNLQGSTSEPILTKDKHGEGLSLRETSSWDITSSHPCSAVPRDVLKSNVADAMSKIGDQACSKVKQEENPERDIEAGDANVNKEKEPRDNNFIDNQKSRNVMGESTGGNKEKTYGLPSAPPYSSLHEEKMPRSNEIKEGMACQQNNCNPNVAETADKVYEVLESDVCDSSIVHHHPCTKQKVKQLSPNSSFGFIPHLNRYVSEEEAKETGKLSRDDFTRMKKSEEEVKGLSKKMSEAFNPLAQEFTSAVKNFNEKFQNAREISDVIPKRLQSYDLKESDFKGENNNYLDVNMNVQDFEPKHSKSPDKILTDSEDKAAHARPNYLRDTFTEQELASDSPRFRSLVNENFNLYNDLGKEEPDSTKSFQYDAKKNDVRSDSFETRQTVDESWKRRWYEDHPILDSLDRTNEDLRLRALLRGNRELLTLGNYSNESTHIVGGFGDRGCIDQGPTYDRLNSFLETNQNNSNPSSVKKETSSCSISSDESSVTTERSNRNYTNVSSQSIPYSWRQMCRKQVSSTESEVKAFKQFQKAKENGANLDGNIHASQKSENLSEVIIDKERDEVNNSLDGHWSEGVSKGSGQCEMQENPGKDEFRNEKLGNEENSKSEEHQKHLNPSGESFYRQSVPYFGDHERIEGCKITSTLKQSEENIKNLESKGKVVTSEARQDGRELRVYGPEKVEPGLNSACGDFVPAGNERVQEQDVNNQPSDRDIEENLASNAQESFQSITEDYLEEIVGRVAGEMEEDFKDSAEVLDLSSYSESEDRSSDFSEAEEAIVNEQ